MENLKKIWERDKYAILLLLATILLTIYILTSVNKYNDACNAHWYKQFNALALKCSFPIEYNNLIPFNKSFNINIIGDQYADKNIS